MKCVQRFKVRRGAVISANLIDENRCFNLVNNRICGIFYRIYRAKALLLINICRYIGSAADYFIYITNLLKMLGYTLTNC